MKILNIEIRGQYYKVDEHGCIFGGENNVIQGCKSGHQWTFIGVSKHRMNSRPTVSFQDIWENPKLAINGYFWDIDHGTVRLWLGSYNGQLPRVTNAYID
jgi:hypothetical protein